MVQVENEYGAFPACDKPYLNWLRDETKKHVQEDALLFTVDMPNENALTCGSIEGVFVTTDFGIDRGKWTGRELKSQFVIAIFFLRRKSN